MMDMKIGLAHKRLDLKGGTERDLYRTAEGLRDLGHDVHLFCAEFGVEAPRGTFAHRIPVLPFGRTAQLWSAACCGPKTIRRHRCDVVVNFGRILDPDVVRSGGGTHLGYLQRIAEEDGMRRRVWQRFSIYHRTLLALEERQFSSARYKKVIAVSERVKRDVMEHYPVPAERIVVLYNGVDQERFHPSLRHRWRCQIRRELAIPERSPLVLFVGNGFRRKGLERLLEAWALPKMGETYLLVVGDDARMGYYKARAKTLAHGRIIFVGRREAVERYYGAADVVALPSIQEAFGNVVLEGLACGLPAIVARDVGAAEVLSGGLGGGIVENPDDPVELAETIAAQLKGAAESAYRDEARRLGEAFSWRSHFRRLEDVLSEVRSAKQRERVS
jgi:UDP-glucose:(heptosyl)LPS alpha-1,3-glucosyltransferase